MDWSAFTDMPYLLVMGGLYCALWGISLGAYFIDTYVQETLHPTMATSQPDKRLVIKDNSLCSACGAVDWQILVDHRIDPSFAWRSLDGRPVRRIEATCEELRASTCRICRILSTIKDLTTEREQSPYASELQMQTSPLESQDEFAVLEICQLSHKIEERTSRPFDSFRWNGSQGNFLALFGPDQEVGPRKTPTLIQNFGWMRAAIDQCCEHHGIRCNLIPTSSVHRLRVIDCFNSASTISVILPPKPCQYVALSYVWGPKPNNEHNVPIVIRDAIEVTRALGIRYLWVDKYCIPQDGQEKQLLICSMDQIYSQAYVTIIAAAGKSADEGLPGIGETPRKAQVEVKAHNCTFIEVPLAINTIRASTWATRGWTYQEAYLSPRRLLFTDVGVSYYCGSIHIEESVQQLLPKRSNAFMEPSEQYGTMEPSKEYGDLFRYRALPVHVGVPFSMEPLIEHYTRRQLSNHEDSLNAFQGIASYCSHLGREERTDNICGLPIVNGTLKLQWYHEKPAVRRPDFPSWSWAGWAGGVKFGSDAWLLPEDHPYPFLEPISVDPPSDLPRHLRDGSEGRWLRAPWTVETPKRLFVTGPILALRLSNAKEIERVMISTSHPPNDYLVPRTGAAPRYCMLECFPGIFAAAPIKLDSQTTIRGTLFGLMVTSVSSHKSDVDDSYRVHVESIIVLENFGWLYKRVGYVDMMCAKWNGGRSEAVFVDSKAVLIDWHDLPWRDTNIKRPWLDEVERKQIWLE